MRQKCYLTLATGACGLSRISYAYLTWVAMWDRFFQRRVKSQMSLSGPRITMPP